MAAVMNDPPGASLRQMAGIVERAFHKKQPRFTMTEDAVHVLFALLFRRLADSADNGDLSQKLAHLREHGAEFLERMREYIPDNEWQHAQLHGQPIALSAKQVAKLVAVISNRWFPEPPLGFIPAKPKPWDLDL